MENEKRNSKSDINQLNSSTSKTNEFYFNNSYACIYNIFSELCSDNISCSLFIQLQRKRINNANTIILLNKKHIIDFIDNSSIPRLHRYYWRTVDNKEPMHTFVAGSLSGIAARFITAPLDVIKLDSSISMREIESHIIQIYRSHGVKGLYRGNLINCVRAIPYNGLITYCYASLLCIVHPPSYKQSILIGGIAGLVAITATFPVDYVRAKLLLKNNRLIDIRAISMLYSGSLLSLVPFIAIQQSTQDVMRLFAFKYYKPCFSVLLLCGFLTAAAATIITYPLEVIRKYRNLNENQSTSAFIKSVLEKNGFLGFYRGVGIAFFKIVPTVGIGLAIRDTMLKRID